MSIYYNYISNIHNSFVSCYNYMRVDSVLTWVPTHPLSNFYSRHIKPFLVCSSAATVLVAGIEQMASSRSPHPFLSAASTAAGADVGGGSFPHGERRGREGMRRADGTLLISLAPSSPPLSLPLERRTGGRR
jgi:hypothetical protein